MLSSSHRHAVIITHTVHVRMRLETFLIIFVEKDFYLFVFAITSKLILDSGTLWSMTFDQSIFGLALTRHSLVLRHVMKSSHFFRYPELIFVEFLIILGFCYGIINLRNFCVTIQALQLL